MLVIKSTSACVPIGITSQVFSQQSKYHLTSSVAVPSLHFDFSCYSFPCPESQKCMLFFIFHIEKNKIKYVVTRLQLYDWSFVRKKWLKAIMAKLLNSISSTLVVNILFPIWCPSSINTFAARPNFFFSLSDNEISWGSHVPNYVQFQTAQHSYIETAVKSNVGVTQIHFFPLPAAHWVTQLPRSSTFYTTKGSRD